MKSLKLLIACCISMVCFGTLHAVSPKQYVYDTKEVDGHVVSKVVYVHNNDMLTKQIMYEFGYYPDGRVKEKKALKWNDKKGDWEPAFRITYSYERDNIHSTYGLWDKKKKDFSLNQQTLVSPLSTYDEIFS